MPTHFILESLKEWQQNLGGSEKGMTVDNRSIILSAGNINHYHHTAVALQQAGLLHRYLCVFTGKDDLGKLSRLLPVHWRKRLRGKYLADLDLSRTETIAWPYLLTQAARRLGLLSEGRTNAFFGRLYDRATAQRVDGCEVFHFVNGMGLETARRVKSCGALIVCDVRAEHVDAQESILREEYERLGLPYRSTRVLFRDRLVEEYDLADAIIVPSQYVAGTYVRHGISRDKLHVVPYGVDLPRFAAREVKEEVPEKVTDKAFRAIYVGKVIPRKGIHYLMEALEQLSLGSSELLIVGVIDNDYYEKLMPLALRTNVRFFGRIPQAELWQYYRESDVLVLPSLADSFGLVVVEAMAAGLPVIVSENTGAKELIQDGKEGFVTPVRDSKALADRLRWLCENPRKRVQMGRNAADRVQQFTWAEYGRRLLEAYDDILDS